MKAIKKNSSVSFLGKAKQFFDFSVLSIEDNGIKLTFWAIFIPKLCELLFSKLAATFNTFLISGYAENAVGATTSATQIISVFTILLNIVTVGATILISIELGRGDKIRAGRITSTAFFVILITSGVVSLGLFAFAKPLLLMVNLEGEALDYGIEYLKIRGGLIFLPIMSSFLGTMLVCNGKAVHTMISGMLSNLLNVGFVYLLLYAKLIPGLSGTAAIAVATEIACIGSIIYSLIIFFDAKCPFFPCIDKYLCVKIYMLGVPGSLSSFAYNMAITVTVGCIGAMGIVALNAYSYTNNIVTYAATFSTVCASCISVFVGRYAGRGDIESIKKICRLLALLSVVINGSISVVVFLFRNSLLSFFTNNVEIFSMCLIILAIDFVVEVGRGVVHVFEASMNASRNVIVTMLSGIISAWAIIVLFTYVLGIVFGLGLVGCWIAFAISELAKATVYIIYFKKEKWIKTII